MLSHHYDYNDGMGPGPLLRFGRENTLTWNPESAEVVTEKWYDAKIPSDHIDSYVDWELTMSVNWS